MSLYLDAVGTRAQTALEDLKGGKMATLLGVSDEDFDKAINQLKSTLPAKGESLDSITGKLKQLDSEVSGLKTFQNNTLAGTIFRTLGVLGAGSSLINSVRRVNDQPGWAADVKLITDASGLAKSFAELSKARGGGNTLTELFTSKTAGALNVFASLGDAARMHRGHSESGQRLRSRVADTLPI